MKKSIQSIGAIVVVCLICTLTLNTPVSHAVTVDPNQSSFHLYGAVFNPTWTASDRAIWFVFNYVTGQESRIDCFFAESKGCNDVDQGHWLVVDGYLTSEGWCFDGPCNILRVTKAMAWDESTGSWYEIVSPK